MNPSDRVDPEVSGVKISVHRITVLLLTCASPALVACQFIVHPASQLIFAALVLGFPIALIALGAQRGGSLGPLKIPLLALLLVLLLAVLFLHQLEGSQWAAAWLLGLPLGLAIQLYVLTLLPLAITVISYGLTFDEFTLTDYDLERFREDMRASSKGASES